MFLRRLRKYGVNLLKRRAHTEHKVIVEGVNINVVMSGSGDRSVLLMPGALGSSWTDFKPQIEKLPDLLPGHTLIAWDPPGYGKSIPPTRHFDMNFFQNDAKCALELMKSLKRPKFSILGWSDGGITGLIIAGRYNSSVDKLAIWGAGAYLNDAEVQALEDIRNVKNWSPRMRQPMETLYGADNFPILWSAWVDTMISFKKQRHGDLCRTEVDNIKVPTLILHGKKDPMIAAEHIPYLRTHIVGCKYHEFPEGKHNIHLRYPEEFNKLVAEFLLQKF